MHRKIASMNALTALPADRLPAARPAPGSERLILQIAVAIGCLVPISAGAAGMLLGPRLLGASAAGSGDLDSHFRYLSGLLLGIGLGYASAIPRIETHGARFQLLTGIVVAGGIGRLLSLLAIGPQSPVMLAALGMELLVTPGLALWQRRVARLGHRAAADRTPLLKRSSGGSLPSRL
jgi:Domain of unknown function (DUF4345)